VVEGFRPGVLARLGIDYETVRQDNPGIVYCSLAGFGQDGPYRLRPAHDLDFLALSGVLSLMGRHGERPTIPMNLIADYAGASLHAALGIMFALYARERTGTGQQVDISYLDTTLAVLAASPPVTAWLGGAAEPSSERGIFTGEFPYYSIYADRDGRLMSISATEPWLFENLCQLIGRPDLSYGAMPGGAFSAAPTGSDAQVRAGIAEALRAKTREEWFEILGAGNVCVGIVNDVPAAFADPQIEHRQMALRLDTPAAEGGVLHPGIPIKLTATPGSVRTMPAGPGEHTDDILRELGYSDTQIDDLHDRKLV
jgi:crotonobetainyl-CoA:carnitine CoA-transferase CaiB-like acyl-CoA transferase